MKDKSSVTGTITHCDSAEVRIKRMDESVNVLQWKDIDSIGGKRLKTFFGGMNIGYFHVPYFSVFRNEAMTGRAPGVQYKLGTARRGRRLLYGHLTAIPAKPYSITKFGFGTFHYSKKSTYLSDRALFWGAEYNFLNAKYNNGAQYCFEPMIGVEKRIFEQVRINAKFALQLNIAGKNTNAGFSISAGFHLLKKDFRKHYSIINKERRLPVKKPGVFGIQ